MYAQSYSSQLSRRATELPAHMPGGGRGYVHRNSADSASAIMNGVRPWLKDPPWATRTQQVHACDMYTRMCVHRLSFMSVQGSRTHSGLGWGNPRHSGGFPVWDSKEMDPLESARSLARVVQEELNSAVMDNPYERLQVCGGGGGGNDDDNGRQTVWVML